MWSARSNVIMFYNYFRNAVRLRAYALHYMRDQACLHSKYLLRDILSRVEGTAHALTFGRRKMFCILRLRPSAQTPHCTTHFSGPPYTSVVFTIYEYTRVLVVNLKYYSSAIVVRRSGRNYPCYMSYWSLSRCCRHCHYVCHCHRRICVGSSEIAVPCRSRVCVVNV